MDELDFSAPLRGAITAETSTTFQETTSGFQWGLSNEVLVFRGIGFTYDSDGVPTGGTVTSFSDTYLGENVFQVSGLNTPATAFVAWATNPQGSGSAVEALLAGSDTIVGSDTGNRLFAYAGDDSIVGGAGADYLNSGTGNNTLMGGAGSDTLDAATSGGGNTLFGGDGNDLIRGGTGFDQVNGNVGDDTIISHSLTGDWLLGGQGQDSIDASVTHSNNIINGNLGNDTLLGGSGNDTLRGGQGDDVIHVGSGNAWISGDLGNNTIFGGQGTDTFHAGAGHDVINGWHSGDHVQVDGGVSYVVTQVNADVHIVFLNGGEVDLLNTQQSSLQSGWIG